MRAVADTSIRHDRKVPGLRMSATGSCDDPVVTPTDRLRELAMRHAAFAWLDRQRAAGQETFSQKDTSGLTLAGETVRLMPTQQGIWKPGQLAAALSIRTVYRSEGSSRP